MGDLCIGLNEIKINSIIIDPLIKIEGKKIRKSQLAALKRLAQDNKIELKEILKQTKIEDGKVIWLSLY